MMFGTIVDSRVLLDVFTENAQWGEWSAEHLAAALARGPVLINPLIYAELSVGFGRIEDLEDGLPDQIEREALPWEAAFLAGCCFVHYRRPAAPAALRCRTSPSPPTRPRPVAHS